MIMTVTMVFKVTILKGEQEVEEIKMKITLFMLYFITVMPVIYLLRKITLFANFLHLYFKIL